MPKDKPQNIVLGSTNESPNIAAISISLLSGNDTHIPAFRKTRIAPTPSGFLHLGNAASFLLTAQLARQHQAALLLRIDDLDRERFRTEYLEDIFSTLHLLHIAWTEGPQNPADFEHNWSQHQRLHQALHLLDQLAAQNEVFACTCSRAHILQHSSDGSYPGTCINRRLPLQTPGACWRLSQRATAPIIMRQADGSLLRTSLPNSQQHAVVRKKDALPSYHLASLADDLHFGIDFIVRGADLLPSTLLQLHLAQVLHQPAFTSIRFLHHPLITDSNNRKLSKSAGDTSIQYLRRHLSESELQQQLQTVVQKISPHP